LGDAVRTPVQVRINTANPRPNSNNPEFIKNWIDTKPTDFPDYFGIAESWQKGEKVVNKNNVMMGDETVVPVEPIKQVEEALDNPADGIVDDSDIIEGAK